MSRSTHSQRLEAWLGAEQVERISLAMRGHRPEYRWYGKPIAVANVPGRVYATADGDFVGPIRGGQAASMLDYYEQWMRRVWREWARRQGRTMNAGFASLSDLILEMTTNAKRREFAFQKVGTTGVVAATNTLWYVGAQPSAGAAAGAAPGGTIPTDATAGAFPFDNPTGGDFQHFMSGWSLTTVVANTLLLYDRLFSVTKTMNSTGTEAVTGVPTRYQNTTAGTDDYIGGNFGMIECRTALPATAHNWTVCTYLDQANAASTLPSVTGNASNIINRLDQPTSQWFVPLEAGDTGIKAWTQMQCSALVASGNIDFTIGHPLMWFPHPTANLPIPIDGINSAANFVRIHDDAAMAFLEVTKPATGATSYTGQFLTARG